MLNMEASEESIESSSSSDTSSVGETDLTTASSDNWTASTSTRGSAIPTSDSQSKVQASLGVPSNTSSSSGACSNNSDPAPTKLSALGSKCRFTITVIIADVSSE